MAETSNQSMASPVVEHGVRHGVAVPQILEGETHTTTPPPSILNLDAARRAPNSGHHIATSAMLRALAARRQTLALKPGLSALGAHHQTLTLRPTLSRSLCTASNRLTAKAWQELAKTGAAPPLRFPVGTPVRCFVGERGWLTGTVVVQHYREASWPAEETAPYQILLNDEHINDPAGPNAIWAPADVDELIQTNFRLQLGADVECRVGEHEWVRCAVVGYMYAEKEWPSEKFAPYQVRVVSVLPGSVEIEQLEQFVDKLIWIPKDNPQNIRPFSDVRWEALMSLVDQRDSGRLDEQEFLDKRISIIHDEHCTFSTR